MTKGINGHSIVFHLVKGRESINLMLKTPDIHLLRIEPLKLLQMIIILVIIIWQSQQGKHNGRITENVCGDGAGIVCFVPGACPLFADIQATKLWCG